MSSYLSHPTPPQSRFLANAPSPSTRTPSGSSTKHLAPSLSSSSQDGKDSAAHPLRTTWVFWFRQQRIPGKQTLNYEEGIKRLGAIGTVESFWALHAHLTPPSLLAPTTDYLIFHGGVRRPVWEDAANRTGGKWTVRLRKGLADRLWEDLVLALVGGQFTDADHEHAPEDGSEGGEDDGTGWPEVCGCTISVRQSEDVVQVWNRCEEPRAKEKIKETIKRVLNLGTSTVVEYKSNNDSMQDRPAFRQPTADRAPLS